MSKYNYGIFAVCFAVGAVAFTVPEKKMSNQFKIIDIEVVGLETRLITDDNTADPSINCQPGNDVCKAETNQSLSFDGTNYYLVRGGDVNETPGQFQ